MGAVGSESAQWLDDGSEHPHRIALSVQSFRVPEVSQRLAEGCASRNVKVPVVQHCLLRPLLCSEFDD